MLSLNFPAASDEEDDMVMYQVYEEINRLYDRREIAVQSKSVTEMTDPYNGRLIYSEVASQAGSCALCKPPSNKSF